MATPAIAKDNSGPLTIGRFHTEWTHDAERRVNVVLPAGYNTGEKQYPLILMLDGGTEQDLYLALGAQKWNQLWQRSEPAIFVGIETVDHQRELLPQSTVAAEKERFPTAGESAEFRDWLSNKILPKLRQLYRDDGRAFLIGESAAGHFVAETWFVEPDLFSGYAAISPSLQWDNQALARKVGQARPVQRPKLYISLANEGGKTEGGVERLVSATDASICFSDRRDELAHANALHGLLPEALQYLLPTDADWLDDFGLVLRCASSTPSK